MAKTTTTLTSKTPLTPKAPLPPKAPLMLRKDPASHKDAASNTEAEDAAAAVAHVENYSQKKKQEPGRFWLQVDRQTKSSYDTFEAAQANGLLIKKQFSLLQVAVYDKQESTNTLLEWPAAGASVSDPA